MPIRLQCSCGKSLELPDHLVGKKVRCLDCKKVLRIKPPRAVGEVKPAGLDSLAIEGTKECPGCKQIFFENVEVCIACGINLKTGAQLYQSSASSVEVDGFRPPRRRRNDESADGSEEDEGGGFFRRLFARLFGRSS